MRAVPVPRPSRGAYRFYNTLVFHGYFRTFVTLISLATGIWMLFLPDSARPHVTTALGMHLVAGFFGIYLVASHVTGYFLCRAVQIQRMAEPRKQLTDTGWVMVGLATTSLVTGLALWRHWIDDPATLRFARVVHVAAALCYIALSVTHFHYYWNRWKPALRTRGPAESPSADS